MRVSCGSQMHRAGALWGVLYLAFLSGCISPEQAEPYRGTDPSAAPRHREDPPPSAKTLYTMADILATQGKDVQCEFVLRRCISQYPRFTPAYNSLAELELRQGRVHEAVDALSRALALRPRDPVLLNNLGMCFLVRREYAEALAHFTEAAGIVPESEKYRANMATCLGLLGRHEESFALLQQILPETQALRNAEILRKAHEKQADLTASAPG